jgi:type II secretory pathway predicted ATPase ExeA
MTRMPWVSHFGFSRMPFSKAIPANKLCERASHQEAVARIRFCIAESLLGVITGQVSTCSSLRRYDPSRDSQTDSHGLEHRRV